MSNETSARVEGESGSFVDEIIAAMSACHLQMLRSNNDSEYAQEANEMAKAVFAKLAAAPEPKVGESGLSDEDETFPKSVHEWLQDALGRYQVTHIHSSIRAALKVMDLIESDPDELPEAKPEPLPNTHSTREEPCEWNGRILSDHHDLVDIHGGGSRCVKCKNEWLADIQEMPAPNTLQSGAIIGQPYEMVPHEEALAIVCPLCHSGIGQACKYDTGEEYKGIHLRRHAKAFLARPAAPKVVDSKEYICTDPECFGDCHPIRKPKVEEQDGEQEQWVIVFADPDVPNEFFAGLGAEEAAKFRYKQLLINWNCILYRSVAETVAPPSLPTQDEDDVELELSQAVRLELFLSHSCDGKYGDDGEMQCNRTPFIDFKRDFPSEILAKSMLHRLSKAAAPVAPLSGKEFHTRCTAIHPKEDRLCQLAIGHASPHRFWFIGKNAGSAEWIDDAAPVALPTHQLVSSNDWGEGQHVELRCSCGRIFIGLGDEALARSRASFEAHLPGGGC